MIIVFGVQWGVEKHNPGFVFLFDSGGIIAVWIPLLVMLLFSLYDVRGVHKSSPAWGDVAFRSVVIATVLSLPMYIVFHYEILKYDNWVKWVSIVVIIYLFIVLSISRYLEDVSGGDLQSERAEEQSIINKKLDQLNHE